MVDQPLLSICIATYNRGRFIGETLASMVHQLNDRVEIVLVDGGSKDETEQVVTTYQQSCKAIRYFRQDRNMGLDQDFAAAVAHARGKYCWLFSDDDILKPHAIAAVLRIAQENCSLIIANAEVWNANLSRCLQASRLPFHEDRKYLPSQMSELLADCGRFLSFIGCVIIRRDLWAARDKDKYIGSYFVHVGVIFQRPFPTETIAIADPLIQIRYGNATWLAKYFEIWMFKWPNLVWSFEQFDDCSKSKVCPKEPWRNLPRLMLHRAKGTYTLRTYSQMVKPKLSSPWVRAAVKCVAYIPGRVANFIGFIHYSFFARNSDRSLGLLDMQSSPYYWCRHLSVVFSNVKKSTNDR